VFNWKQKKPILFKVTEPSSCHADPSISSDYGWPGPGGSEVRRPFGSRGMSSVRYGTRLGDLKENWFLLFSNLTLNTRCTQAVAGLG